MDPTSPTADLHAIDNRMVETPAYCIRCGYQLQGLARAGVCPECGTNVASSLLEPTLAAADPEYLRGIYSGLRIVLGALLTPLILVILVGAVGFSGVSVPEWMEFIPGLLLLAGSVLLVIGFFGYTRPDPGEVALESRHSARRMIRSTTWILVGTALGLTLNNLLAPLFALPWALRSPLERLPEVLNWVLGGTWIVVFGFQFVQTVWYTRVLATRVPDVRLITLTKRYVWLIPLVFILGLGCLFMVGPLIALVLYWNLLNRLRRHLKSILAGNGPADLSGRLPRAA